MNTLILIFFGTLVGGLVSPQSNNSRSLDMLMGILGALASSAFISALGLEAASFYTTFNFLIVMLGAVVIIYMGRSLNRLPQN